MLVILDTFLVTPKNERMTTFMKLYIKYQNCSMSDHGILA